MTEVRQEIEPAAPEMPGILPAADGRGSPSSEKAPTSALLPPGLPDEPAQNLLQLRPPEPAGNDSPSASPRGVDKSLLANDGAYADAWKWFVELDTDKNGSLDLQELTQLMKKCKVKVAKRDIRTAFKQMDMTGLGTINFEAFAGWWNIQKEQERRRMRRTVKECFEAVDVDESGRLDQDEFTAVAKKAKNALGIDPPFDPASDWEMCKKLKNPATGEDEVTYQAFEAWWKERLGIVDADIPVLPEYMVQKIDEAHYYASKRERAQAAPEKDGADGSTAEAVEDDRPPARSARELWGSLRPRLLSVVRMQRQWGPLHDIYDSQQASRFELNTLPRWTRDPDSNFSAAWDLTQVVLLLYVAITVPLRAGFSLEVELWSLGFFVDMFIDIYFITDICLNFKTAYYNKDGTREERLGPIAIHYMKGWFFIDFVSTLPVSYVPYFIDQPAVVDVAGSLAAAAEAEGASNFRAMKALRLVRLSKMLRLARIKKILMKYGDNVNLQTYINVGFTMFTIFFLVHLLTCFFYMVGSGEEVRPKPGNTADVIIPGWVMQEEGWEWTPEDGKVQDTATGWDDAVGLGTRYVTSTYYVLNALENASTDGEKGFALFAELMRDFILGLVAGLMTTISMAMNGGEQESQWKLRALKGWMQKNNLPKTLQIRIQEYCHELWGNRSGFNIDELFADVPPAMRVHLKQFLYSSIISQVPLFRGLSSEVIGALCNVAQPMYALNGQTVMEEGQPVRAPARSRPSGLPRRF